MAFPNASEAKLVITTGPEGLLHVCTIALLIIYYLMNNEIIIYLFIKLA